MRNVSIPLGISIPEQPNIASTRWRTVADQKNKVYYFESTLSPDIFWINFKDLNFKTGAPVKKLTLTGREIYAGIRLESHFTFCLGYRRLFCIFMSE